ncbi:MAG: 50S ribosomal protein L11 methyltransferase [Lachnospiraceae bacterium]|nr:50S ribosomal protein L11 methyltransferase [Lachnospiraceae bacterium]
MKWNKYTIHTSEEAEDPVSAILAENGITGMEIEDKKPVTASENGGYFGDVVPEMPADDHLSDISFYLEDGQDAEPVLTSVKAALEDLRAVMDIGPGTISEGSTDEEDWINNWKQYFHSFFIDDIYIEPTWEEGSEEEKEAASRASMVLHIDPGTAFGTGKHESTQLAIRALRKYVKAGDEILDIGTGSGILGIVGLKEGAGHVFGTDLDDNTLPAIEDNLRQNGIREDQFTRILGNIADDRATQDAVGYGKYNLVLANIIAEILATITPAVPATLVDGGIYITSGILEERESVVLEAGKKAGFDVLEINHMGDWSCIVFSYRRSR